MLTALLQELEGRQAYLSGAPIQSVYFGGGTPSILPVSDLVSLFEQVARCYAVSGDAEITLEANPDDLTLEKLQDLRRYTPVNRLSIGIQSFQEADLQWMNRAHNAREAHTCLDAARRMGFDDLTIDLIYGAPVTSDADWAENLRLAFDYDIPHLSCYCLTVEEGTALHHFVKTQKMAPVEEEKAARQFEYLMDTASANGYEQYEISNFARHQRYARHNSSYWLGQTYLGIGPSAHSYDGQSRQWNIAHNPRYIEGILNNSPAYEREVLTPQNLYNEYVMTALRTMRGVDCRQLALKGDFAVRHFTGNIAPFLDNGSVEVSDGCYYLTRKGKLMADSITAALFVV